MKYFDLHCDTASVCQKNGYNYWSDNLAVSFDKASVFEIWKQFFAIWIDDKDENPYETYLKTLKKHKDELQNKPQNLTPFITLENAGLLQGNIERLYRLYNDGVKAITLTWNGDNLIAGGASGVGRLTSFGKEVIKIMNELHIYCDVSHLNEESFYDVIEVADYPIATHSNCKILCDHKRNLSDTQLRLLNEKGGIVGLCFYPAFLNCDVFEGIYRNLYHIYDLGFDSLVACGSDFDGGEMQAKLNSIDKIPCLKHFLHKKGISDNLLDDFFYNNAEKIFVSL